MLAGMAIDSKSKSHVRAWRASGLSAAAYAADRGIPASSLRYWARQIKEKVPEPEVRLARVVAPGASHDEPVLIEAHGVRMAVRRGFDRDVLRDVLGLLLERAS